MTDKLYQILNRPRFIKGDIRRMNERVEDVRIMMLPSAIRYDTDKIISSPQDPMLKFAERLDDLEQKRNKLMEEYINARDVMFKYIDRLTSETHKDIIQSRFLSEIKFNQIAESLGYSESQIFREYADAIEILENMIVNDSE